MMRCPVSKFITHTISHFYFLIFLAVATFGLEEIIYDHESMTSEQGMEHTNEKLIQSKLRPAGLPITQIQILIIFYIFGMV
jgi:hypothetical protein